ncbi:hypothetical protein BsWGS_04297 [Bradybaena similaris]
MFPIIAYSSAEDIEKVMGVECYLKTQLGLLHCLAGLVAGFFCLYSVLSWGGPTDYLPDLVAGTGKFIPSNNGLPFLCECIVYGMGALSFLSFLMCAVASCSFKSACLAFFHMMLVSVSLAFSVMGASVISIYYIVWCDLLQQAVAGSYGCDEAAVIIDTRNASAQMSSHRSFLEIQMAVGWTLLPLLCLTLLTYSVIIRIADQPEVREGPTRYVVLPDETTPLLRAVASSHTSIEGVDAPCSHTSIQRGHVPCNHCYIHRGDVLYDHTSIHRGDAPCNQISIQRGNILCNHITNQRGNVPCNETTIQRGDVPYTHNIIQRGDIPYTQTSIQRGDVPYTHTSIQRGGVPYTHTNIQTGDVPCNHISVQSGDIHDNHTSIKNCDVPYSHTSNQKGDFTAESSHPIATSEPTTSTASSEGQQ